MFEKYDEKCELRVRRSFRCRDLRWSGWRLFVRDRLRQLHVAEAQVFKPERDEFDE